MASNKNKSIGSLLVIVVLVLFVIGKKCIGHSSSDAPKDTEAIRSALIQHTLSYTKHATCRMECRDITKEEVEHVLETGILNSVKSEEHEGNCPTYAFEGKSIDGQSLRIIFGHCPKTTKVITCIDLGVEHDCHCP